MDINSSISNFLKKEENADAQKVKKSLDNLQSLSRDDFVEGKFTNVSIFGNAEEINKDTFYSAISELTGENIDKIKDDADVLFSVLDIGGGNANGSLSRDELDMFLNGDDDINIEEFWTTLTKVNMASIIEEQNAEKVSETDGEKSVEDSSIPAENSDSVSNETKTNDTKTDDKKADDTKTDDKKTDDKKTDDTKGSDTSSDVDKKIIKEFDDLNIELKNAKNETERKAVRDKMNKLAESANLSDLGMKNYYSYQLESTRDSQDSELLELYNQISSDNTPEKNKGIEKQILDKKESFSKELKDLRKEIQSQTKLPKEQADVLNSLYDKLSDAKTDSDRKNILSELKTKQQEFELNDYEKSLSLELSSYSLSESYGSEILGLEKELYATSDVNKQNELQAKINTKNSDKQVAENNMYIEWNMFNSGIPKDVQSDLTSLYEKLSNAKDMNEVKDIEKQIAEKEKNLTDEQKYRSILSQRAAGDSSYTKMMTDYENQLLTAKDDKEKSEISNKIDKLSKEYNSYKDQLDEKLKLYDEKFELKSDRESKQNQSKLPEAQAKELNALYDELSKAPSQKERDEVLKKIDAKQAEYKLSNEEKELSNKIKLAALEESQKQEYIDSQDDSAKTINQKNAKNKEITNSQKAEKAKLKRQNLAAQSTLDKDKADALNTLYDNLAAAKDEESRNKVLEDLDKLRKQYNLSDEEYKLSLEQQYCSTEESQSNSLSSLYKQYSEATDKAEKRKLADSINEMKYSNKAERIAIKDKISAAESKLNDDQAKVFDSLYNKLSTATTQKDRDDAIKEIKEAQSKYGLSSAEKEISLKRIKYNMEISQNNHLSSLYKELENAKTQEERNAKRLEIEQFKENNKNEINKVKKEINSAKSKLPDKQASELNTLYDNLEKEVNPKNARKIISEINQKISDYDISDKEIELSQKQQIISIENSYSERLDKLYSKLKEAGSDTDKQSIQKEISDLIQERNYLINEVKSFRVYGSKYGL